MDQSLVAHKIESLRRCIQRVFEKTPSSASQLSDDAGRGHYQVVDLGEPCSILQYSRSRIGGSLPQPDPPFRAKRLVKDAWQDYTALADRYNDPGRFTAIIGFEYTTRGGYNMQRNVLFRADDDRGAGVYFSDPACAARLKLWLSIVPPLQRVLPPHRQIHV
jgi:hypothetical protein